MIHKAVHPWPKPPRPLKKTSHHYLFPSRSYVVTLDSLTLIALILHDRGKCAEAEAMQRQALAGSKKELGLDHPDTLTSAFCLAYLLVARVLGAEHPITAAYFISRESISSAIDGQLEQHRRAVLCGMGGTGKSQIAIPNPMFFQPFRSWPMDDRVDPLAGWPVWEVARTPHPASQDAYGKLFVYLQMTLQNFLESLDCGRRDFELYQMDVTELSQHLNRDCYDRIEMANISDAGYIGTRESLNILTPLLRTPQQNPHATAITLYLNAVMEVVKSGDESEAVPDMVLLIQYMPNLCVAPPRSMNGADMYRFWDARSLTLDAEKFFQIYMRQHNLRQISKDLDIVMKPNTLIQSWPTRLKLEPGQKGAQVEFYTLLGFNLSGLERYVEWKRGDPQLRIKISKSLGGRQGSIQ